MKKHSIIQATLTKLNANTKDKLDSIQFQLREDGMEKYGQEVLKIRRFENIQIRVENTQSQLTDKGLEFFTAKFQSMATSVSICVTEKGLICTITLSIDDRTVFNDLVSHDLRNKILAIEFTDGDNPYSK